MGSPDGQDKGMDERKFEDVLGDFESAWHADQNCLHEFLKGHSPVASSELQFALLKRELRLRLLDGQTPSPIDYQKRFPHFAASIDQAIAEQLIFVSRDALPIERRFGDLPRHIEGYDVLNYSGRDGVSVFYDAIQRSLSRKVRLRAILFPSQAAINKARTVAKLEHPNFENTIDVFESESIWFVVSQLESGSSISKTLSSSSRPVSLRSGIRWIRTVADALMELHRRDIAHGNVSPSRIFVRFGGEAVLLNPSFENLLNSVLNHDSEETLRMNSPFPYRSIVYKSTVSRDPPSDDTAALGLVFFQLLTGLHMENFYLNPPLPSESPRLKTLIADQLDYAVGVDSELKQLCRRSTLGLMDGVNPCRLPELRNGLLAWEQRHDKRLFHEAESGSRAPKGLTANPTKRGFPWF